MSEPVLSVVLLALQPVLQLVDLVGAALVLGAIVLDELVEAGVAGSHLKTALAAPDARAARVRRTTLGLHTALVFHRSHLMVSLRSLALSLGSGAISADHVFLS